MQADFTSQDFFRDPAAGIARLRAIGPLVQVRFPLIGTVWVTTTRAAAERLLKDDKTFAMRMDGRIAGLRWWLPGLLRTLTESMVTMDEPDHRRLRELVDEAFRRRAVLDMQPRIEAIADDLAKRLFGAGNPADLVERFARPLPLAVICELLGLPDEDRPKFTAWGLALTRFTSGFGFVAALPAIAAIKRYLQKRLDIAREGDGEGLIAELVRVEREGGRISRDEAVAMLVLLLFAGHETTTHLISGSVYELLRNPGLRDWLEEDQARIEPAVEEFLRFVAPVQFSKPRVARADAEIGGVRVKKGERVMAMLSAANFDPLANEQPERLDLARKPSRHVSFGTGIHFCLGHQLARIEGACALNALFRRWPKLELAVPESDIRWRERAGLRALVELPVRPGA